MPRPFSLVVKNGPLAACPILVDDLAIHMPLPRKGQKLIGELGSEHRRALRLLEQHLLLIAIQLPVQELKTPPQYSGGIHRNAYVQMDADPSCTRRWRTAVRPADTRLAPITRGVEHSQRAKRW